MRAQHDRDLAAFVELLHRIRSRAEFSPGARGWGYLCELEGVIDKGEFDSLEESLADWRKQGIIPLSLVGEDDKRAADNLESLDESDPRAYAETYAGIAAECWKNYTPVSFWEFQRWYIELFVEKVDLKHLFRPVCEEFHVTIVNAGGWSDINSRANLMLRFKEHDEAGRKCVLLYCGDHDPDGLRISDTIRENLLELEKAVGWLADEDHLTIDRFGLNEDFIKANRLTWIDGLMTGSGKDLASPKHPNHHLPYVQSYLKRFGARKVEANALVARPVEGRELCRDAIRKYLDPDGIEAYEERLAEEREKVKEFLPAALREALEGGIGS
jgi:hypothetical protein